LLDATTAGFAGALGFALMGVWARLAGARLFAVVLVACLTGVLPLA
jgi:hypothetical protein